MSETISLEFIGQRLRAIQSQLNAQQIEIELARKELARFAGTMITREMLSEVVQVLAGRIGAFEALIDTRMIQVEGRIGQVEGRIGHLEARIGSLEARIGHLEARIAGLETTVDNGIAGLNRSNQDVIQLLTRVLGQGSEGIGKRS
ncbi:MAG TPA: hypothetical protein VNE67_17975 [Acetobacteraceae bacterium]|nr:hypothetical protein [Acetobacteraceae bacterium]